MKMIKVKHFKRDTFGMQKKDDLQTLFINEDAITSIQVVFNGADIYHVYLHLNNGLSHTLEMQKSDLTVFAAANFFD